MKKNVFFVGGNLYPFRIGGYEVFNYYLFNHLKPFYKTIIFNNKKPCSYYSSNEYCRILNIEPHVIFGVLQYFFCLLFLKNKSGSVIVLSYSKSRWLHWWIYPLLNRLAKLKYIIIIHGGGLTKWDWPYVHKSLFKRASQVIGVSERICDEYKARSGREVRYIPPVIPFSIVESDKTKIQKIFGIYEGEKVISIIGSLKPLKNPKIVIDALEEIGYEFVIKNKLKIVFAGDGVLKQELEKRVEASKLHGNIVFLGNISREKIPLLYSVSDIYVISSEFEGTPISLLEAMANSLIVVGANSPGIKDVIQNGVNGFLFNNKDPKELADLIKKNILMHDAELKNIRLNAKKYVEDHFNYNEMLQQYIDIIDKT